MTTPLIKIEFSASFGRKLKKLKKQNPQIARRLPSLLKTLQLNAFHPKLKTHKLTGELKGKYAFSVTLNMRIVFQWINSNIIILVDIGTHDQVYK